MENDLSASVDSVNGFYAILGMKKDFSSWKVQITSDFTYRNFFLKKRELSSPILQNNLHWSTSDKKM